MHRVSLFLAWLGFLCACVAPDSSSPIGQEPSVNPQREPAGPECSVVVQDCPSRTLGCYMSLSNGLTTCAPALSESRSGEPGTQGDACHYLNTCARGYGCTLLNDPVNTTGNVCAAFCDPLQDSCADEGLPSLTCMRFDEFYGDVPNVPDDIGFCVDCQLWYDVPGCN